MKTVTMIIIFLISHNLLAAITSTPQAITLESIKGKSNEVIYKEAWIKAFNTEEDYQVHSDAIALMDLIIVRDSKFAPAYYLKGLSYRLMAMNHSTDYDMTLLKTGEAEVDKALVLAPHEPLYIVEKADNLYKRKYKDTALQLVEKALKIKPNFSRALLLKTEIMIDDHKLKEAEKLLGMVVKDPNDAFIDYRSDWHWKSIYREKNMPKEEEELHLKGIKNKPKSSWNLVNYASFLNHYDRYQEAIQVTDRCISLSDIGICHHVKAVALAWLGEQVLNKGYIDQAFNHFESALKIEDDNEEALNGLGKIHQKKNNEIKAFEYFEKGCNLKYTSSCNHLGGIFFRKKDYKKTGEYCDKACELEDTSSCSNLADIKWRLGDKSGAIKFFEKACKLGDDESCKTLEKFKKHAGTNK